MLVGAHFRLLHSPPPSLPPEKPIFPLPQRGGGHTSNVGRRRRTPFSRFNFPTLFEKKSFFVVVCCCGEGNGDVGNGENILACIFAIILGRNMHTGCERAGSAQNIHSH